MSAHGRAPLSPIVRAGYEMRVRPLLLTLLLTACYGESHPYEGGGDYPISECSNSGRQVVAATAGEELWDPELTDTDAEQRGRTRDFRLLDDHGYRVRLTHFCGDTVLLVVGSMQDPVDPQAPGPIDWLDDLPDWLQDRDPQAPRLTIMSTYWANADGEVPTVGDLRRFRAIVQETRGSDSFTYSFPVDDPEPGDDGTRSIITLQDPYRFEDAAPAASAMTVVSNVPPDPDPSRRYRREHEVRDRWAHRSEPYFVVLHPVLRIVAMGDDPEEDGIIEALRAVPE